MSADLTARLAALLGEHWTAGMAANGAARKWECVCGERIAMSDAAHRAHVAAVLAEADAINAGRDLNAAVEAIVARHVEAERERIAQAIEVLEAPYQLAPMAIGCWSRGRDDAARIARGDAR